MMPDKPEQPPPTKPGLEFYTYQLIGMGAFALVALLALFGVFGNSTTTSISRAGDISVEATFPTRLRYKTISNIEVHVRNEGQQAMPVEVRFPAAYLSNFSNVKFSPEPKVISLNEFVIELEPIAPGHTRLVSVEVQSEKYGSFSDRIVVKAGDAAAAIDVHTINFP
jgi:uncharacterized protein (DUF58 family)